METTSSSSVKVEEGRDGNHPTKPGKRERKGSRVKDRKVGMENKESRRRVDTSESKAPSSSSSERRGRRKRRKSGIRIFLREKMEIFHSKNLKAKDFRSRTERERSRKVL